MPIVEVPHQFRCPITQDLFEDPVKTCDGQIYERKAIETWFESNYTSPLTNLPLSEKTLTPCNRTKFKVDIFILRANICAPETFIKVVTQGNVEAVKQLNYFENYLALKFDYSDETNGSRKEKNYTLFHLAVNQQNTEMLRFLLSEVKYPHFIADDNEVGYTPLTLAARKDNLEILKLLHQAKVDINGKVTSGYDTPLVYAVRGNNVKTAKFLLAAGANPNARSTHDVFGPSCLHIAASEGYVDCLSSLLEFKANINIRAKRKETALLMAIQNDQFECFKFLLEAGADPNLSGDNSRTPLEFAVNRNELKYVQLLLSKKVNINTQFWGGNTALYRAVYLGDYYVNPTTNLVEFLLKSGASPNLANNWGQTPLHRAVEYQLVDKIKLLLEYDANIYAMDKKGIMPIDMAKDKVADLLMNYQSSNSKKRKLSEVSSENEYELVKTTEHRLKQQKIIDQYQIIHTQKQEIEKLKEEIIRLRDELDSSSTHNTNVNTDLSKPSFFN